jgi:creatinine amidohydrolase
MTTIKKTNYLKELSWTNFVERKKEVDLVIIPTGAFEVYGPHLPLGTDTLVAEKISEIVSTRVKSIIGPTLEVGDSAELDEFPGTITIRPESFKTYLWDSVESLKKWGFTRFLFVNTHVGNVPIIDQVIIDLQRTEGIQCAQVDYWRFIQNNCNGIIETEFAHGHASEAGTSVMLYLYPELVDKSNIVNEDPKTIDKYTDIHTYLPYSAYSESGTIGDATSGSKEKGKLLVERSVERIVAFLADCWNIDNR